MMMADRMFLLNRRASSSREMREDGAPAYRVSLLLRRGFHAQRMEGRAARNRDPLRLRYCGDARYGDKLTEQDKSVADAMHAYWVAFAKSGSPEPKGLPKWPLYSTENG